MSHDKIWIPFTQGIAYAVIGIKYSDHVYILWTNLWKDDKKKKKKSIILNICKGCQEDIWVLPIRFLNTSMLVNTLQEYKQDNQIIL